MNKCLRYPVVIGFFMIIAFTLGSNTSLAKEQLALVEGQSRVIHINDLARVAVGEPTIADVMVIDTSEVLINPLKPGITSLHVWSGKGHNEEYQLRVLADDGTLTSELLTLIDIPGMSAWFVDRNLVVEGQVANLAEQERVEKLAKAYSDSVISLLYHSDENVDQKLIKEISSLVGDQFEVKIVHDNVIIEGEVATEFQHQRAYQLADAFGRPVIDLIQVRNNDEQPQVSTSFNSIIDQISEAIGPEIDVYGINQTIFLEGVVDSNYAKQRIVSIANVFDQPVVDLIQVVDLASVAEPKEVTIDDDPNDLLLKSELIADLSAALQEPGLSLKFYGDTLILEGKVADNHRKDRAQRIAGLFYQSFESFIELDPIPQEYLGAQIAGHLDISEVNVKVVGSNIVLEGTVQDQREHHRVLEIASLYGNVVDLLSVAQPAQVLLQVHVVELDRSLGEELGFTWGSLQAGQLIPNIVDFEEVDFIGNWMMNRSDRLGARLTALERENKAKLLASPSLLTLSGKPASFLVGGEVPIVTLVDDQEMVTWLDYGIKLDIAPVVIGDRIEVELKPEVSDLDWSNPTSNNLPSITTRRTSTNITIEDGSTVVIGGLIQQRESTEIEKIPFLGDLPILGILFRSKNYQKLETELVIFVTPRIIRDGEVD